MRKFVLAHESTEYMLLPLGKNKFRMLEKIEQKFDVNISIISMTIQKIGVTNTDQ